MTDTRDEFGDLLGLYDPVLIAIAAIIVVVVLFALVRYRARPGRTPSTRREARSTTINTVISPASGK